MLQLLMGVIPGHCKSSYLNTPHALETTTSHNADY